MVLINIKNPKLGDVWLRDIDSLMLNFTFDAVKFIKESNGDYTVIGIPSRIIGEVEWCIWDKGFTKAEKPNPLPPVTFLIHRNPYQGKNKEKQTVTINPSPLELFLCDVLDKTIEPGKQYQGDINYSPYTEENLKQRSIFDESNPEFLRSQIMREMIIKLDEIEPKPELSDVTVEKRATGSKSYSSKNEGEKIKERNDFIVASILSCLPDDYNINTRKDFKFADDGSLQRLCTDESSGVIHDELLPECLALRDYLIKLIG